MIDNVELLSVQRCQSNDVLGEGQVIADGFLKLNVTLVKEGNFYSVRLCAIDELTNRLLNLNKIQLCWRALSDG